MNRLMSYYRRATIYIKDFGLVFLSSMLVTLVTSFVINPILARYLSISDYGNALTLCGYVAIISSAIGNSLNNVRLLAKSNESEAHNNYNAILILFSVLGTIIMACLTLLYFESAPATTISLCIYVFLSSLNLYYIVSFRLKLNYINNLLYNVVVCLGYVLGIFLFIFWDFWPLIYICGQLFGLLFLLFTTSLPKEGIHINKDYKNTLKPFLYLCATTLIAQALTLLDRLVLHPLVGEEAVSLYNTAAFFGKGVGTLFAPIALVSLSYFVKDGFIITKKFFWKISGLGIMAVVILFIFSMPVAPFITELLYPTIYRAAEPYILIANIGAMLSALCVLLNPMLLKICNLKWQPVIQIIHGGLYFVLGILGTIIWGIYGFAFACVIANLIKAILMLCLGGKYAKSLV